jgi:hypothetical protein
LGDTCARPRSFTSFEASHGPKDGLSCCTGVGVGGIQSRFAAFDAFLLVTLPGNIYFSVEELSEILMILAANLEFDEELLGLLQQHLPFSETRQLESYALLRLIFII